MYFYLTNHIYPKIIKFFNNLFNLYYINDYNILRSELKEIKIIVNELNNDMNKYKTTINDVNNDMNKYKTIVNELNSNIKNLDNSFMKIKLF